LNDGIHNLFKGVTQMRNKNLMILALVAMIAGLALNANANQAAVAQAPACKVSEEQSFSAKLDEQNQQAFEHFSADQKKAAITTSHKAALTPNDAVQKVLKDQVALNEKPSATAQVK
jgi:hypothetical protein